MLMSAVACMCACLLLVCKSLISLCCLHRDTKNHTMLSPERHLGGQLTTHTLMYAPPNAFDKPEFARKPLIR